LPDQPYNFDKTISVFLSALAHDGFDNNGLSVVLNEQQQYYYQNDDAGRIYTRLYLSCCTDEYRQKLIDFFNANEKNEHTYVIEHNQSDSNKNIVMLSDGQIESIYDIDDVCLKSMNRVVNSVLPQFDSPHPGRTEDFYVPSSVGVRGFCKVDNSTYLLTDPTTESPVYLRAQLSADEDIEAKTSHYKVELENGSLPTYLYVPVSDLSGANSYGEAAMSGYITPESFYGSNRDFRNIEYNYVAGVPMRKIADRDGNTDYDNGNLYCDIMHAKNMYDSTYSMNMPFADALVSCRNYTEVGKCGDKLYLKFDDNISYVGTDGSAPSKTVSTRYSYPKIEYMNKVVTKTTNRHKSYFFSVNVSDLNLEYDLSAAADAESKGYKNAERVKKYIKHDIKTAIRDIARNVCPVQSQLFDVYFDDKS